MDDIQAIGVHATGVRSRVEVGPLLAHPLIEIPQPSEFEAHPWARIHPLVESQPFIGVPSFAESPSTEIYARRGLQRRS